jgi:ribonuclease HI
MIILELSRQQTPPTLLLPTQEPPRRTKRFPSTPIKQKFSTAIDSALTPDIVGDLDDPDTITTELNLITNIIVSKAYATLPKKRPYQATNHHRCQKVVQIDKKLKALRQLRHAIAGNYLPQHLHRHPHLLPHLQSISSYQHSYNPEDWITELNSQKRQIQKNRWNAVREDIYQRRRKQKEVNARRALGAGSVKQVYYSESQVPSLTILRNPNDATEVSAEPPKILEYAENYYTQLYTHKALPNINKPWMKCKTSHTFRERTAKTPFHWPREIIEPTFNFLVRKGNPAPSPGPDGIEKWWLRHVSTTTKLAIIKILNKIINTNNFPSKLKEMEVISLYKKGDKTDLRNYRGIMLANCFYRLLQSWWDVCINEYLTDLHLRYDFQFAARKGYQPHDAVLTVELVRSWAARTNTTIWTFDGDIEKGFDNCAPQAMYDAADFMGLPESVKTFDVMSHQNVSVRIRTPYGPTKAITISGVNVQGECSAPTRFTMGSSMLSFWLSENDTLQHPTITSDARQQRHQPSLTKNIKVPSAEFMDDHKLFAHSLDALKRKIQLYDLFLNAYNMRHQSAKCSISVLHGEPPSPLPHTITVPLHRDPQNTIPYSSDTTCVRASINNPQQQFSKLQTIIDNFLLPTHDPKPPLNAVRKIINSMLIPKLTARLRIQPLRMEDAEILDINLCKKITAYLNWGYTLNHHICFLPLEMNGCGFESIATNNAAILIQTIHRDLNIHTGEMANLIHTTMAEWKCRYNNHQNPFEHLNAVPSLNMSPYYWTEGRKVMKKLGIRIIEPMPTTTSLLHQLSNNFSPLNPSEKTTLTILDNQPESDTIHPPSISTKLQQLISTPPPQIGPQRRLILNSFLSRIQQTPPSNPFTPTNIHDFNTIIQESARLANWKPSNTLATDGSMQPSPVHPGHPRRVTSAIVTNQGHLKFTCHSTTLTILHAELLALSIALILSNNQPTTIYTDHKLSIQWANELPPQAKLRKMSGRAYIQLLHTLAQQNPQVTIKHVKAHTENTDTPSQLNKKADYTASTTSSLPATFPFLIPLFTLDSYTLINNIPLTPSLPLTSIHHYSDQNPIYLVTAKHQTARQQSLLATKHHRHLRPFHQPTPVPKLWQTSPSDFAQRIVLQCRTSTLPTNARISKRTNFSQPPFCAFCKTEIEDEHHIFVQCRFYTEVRNQLATETESHNPTIPKNLIHQLQIDSLLWPNRQCRFYTGSVPDLQIPIPSSSLQRLRYIIQTHFTKLTGHIWGHRYRLGNELLNE